LISQTITFLTLGGITKTAGEEACWKNCGQTDRQTDMSTDDHRVAKTERYTKYCVF